VVLFIVQRDFEEFCYKNFGLTSSLDYIDHSSIARDFQQHYLVGIQRQYDQVFHKLHMMVKHEQVWQHLHLIYQIFEKVCPP